MTDNVAALLDKLSSKLGTTSEHIWGVLTTQAHVEAASECFALGLMAALWVAVLYFVKSRWASWTSSGYWEGEAIGACVALTVLGIIVLATLAVCGHDVLTAVLNPEAYAIDRVLSAVRGR